MHKFVRHLLTEWRRLALPFENETFVVGVSGGADSVGLLVALSELRAAKKLRLDFVVAHFNHELRGAESERDAEFVGDLAKRLSFEFVVGKVRNPKSRLRDQKGNLEQAARHARYEFLGRAAAGFNAFGVLTAHTLDDQAETFLLNLIRGSGAAGLGAMKPVRCLEPEAPSSKSEIRNPKSAILLVRPLLGWARREETENFVRERGAEFRSDAMNEDERFSRVRVRKRLLPLLREFNPKIVETLARTARLLNEKGEASERRAAAIKGPTADDGSGGRPPEEIPRLKHLKNLSKPVLYSLLREWLRRERGDLRGIGSRHIEAVERLIFTRKSGRVAELPGGAAVIKKDGRLFFAERKVEKSPPDN